MSNVVVCDQELSFKVVSEVVSMPLVKECIAYRTRSKVPKINDSMVIEIIRPAENRARLPADVASDLSLSVDNLPDVTIQNLKCELTNLGTRAGKSRDGYMYGFTQWPTYLKSNHIRFGSTLFFTYVKSTQRLMLTKVVHKTTKKRCRAWILYCLFC
ncbi:putative transcription factor B3-Domain family [Helianthus annuus]|uniref:Transcription factor B3-Domain family n=1 Tax=Helianthus annuus TaxID=4232 RepID=A0A9K3DJX2_HELAN|nr:putative transcription factor B3-Domain family [Helianthus annuus]KAJ0633673.1 putative transcription factor B3-Domain family [Helianthus annuus]KAJ0637492.1 putative transcription factor B3-Domain family [Helianthus annuus]